MPDVTDNPSVSSELALDRGTGTDRRFECPGDETLCGEVGLSRSKELLGWPSVGVLSSVGDSSDVAAVVSIVIVGALGRRVGPGVGDGGGSASAMVGDSRLRKSLNIACEIQSQISRGLSRNIKSAVRLAGSRLCRRWTWQASSAHCGESIAEHLALTADRLRASRRV